jgi:hypothetical protein
VRTARAATPLLWLGAPLFPLLRGLPRPVRAHWVAPLLRSRALRQTFTAATHPAVALPVFVAVTWAWHAPALYELALGAGAWHTVQHACFLGAGLLFWFPVVRPYPSRPRWSAWLLVPYLFLGDVANTVLSALLTFSDRVLYPHYTQVPRLGGLTALEDQAAAGVLMWVPGSLVFLLPLFGIAVRLLSGPEPGVRGQRSGVRRQESGVNGLGIAGAGRIALPLVAHPLAPDSRPLTPGFDLLRVPLLGRFLRWRHARLALQTPLALLAAALIYDGLCGPQVGPMNLAGVLPWTHWRGLLILGLLAAGNLFCMACPFTLPRTLARRWLSQGRRWPRWLRGKWLAILLLALFLWAYEAFALWDSPWLTAWIIVGYFVAAFVVDGLFRGAAFCKYLCPIGQFNFVQSLVAPLEVQVRDPAVCADCRTKDCVRGRDGIPGCGLGLHQPRKVGNMDCTFCLDCVHACPHDNLAMPAGAPGRDLLHDPARSGVGRFSRRPDLAALVVLLVFGAFANAAGMVGPVQEWRDDLQAHLGLPAPLLLTSAGYVLALVVLPFLLVGGAALLGRRWGDPAANWLAVATRYSFALVPLGFAMWLAHYSFHLVTAHDTAVPVTQRFAGDLGWAGLGEPHWAGACCRAPVADWLPRLEILCLGVGLLLSLYVGYRTASAQASRPSRVLGALLPWAALLVLLYLAGVWIVLQPMQMRGTLQG